MTNAKTDDPRRPSIQLQVQPPGPSGGVNSELVPSAETEDAQ